MAMLVMGRDRRLCFGRQAPVEIAVVMAVKIFAGLPLNGEQSLEINLDDEREQHEGRREQKGLLVPSPLQTRSDERRAGKEGVSTCRSQGPQSDKKKKVKT